MLMALAISLIAIVSNVRKHQKNVLKMAKIIEESSVPNHPKNLKTTRPRSVATIEDHKPRSVPHIPNAILNGTDHIWVDVFFVK